MELIGCQPMIPPSRQTDSATVVQPINMMSQVGHLVRHHQSRWQPVAKHGMLRKVFPWTGDLARTTGHRRSTMPKIKHIAISTQDVDKTAKFYIDVFGMKEIARVNSPGATGYYLSDGDLNLAILNFKNDQVAGAERGKGYSGIHHIGFQVESLEAIAEKLAEAGAPRRDDINEALGVGQGRRHEGNVEVKYSGPDGVIVDVSETGWVGTSGPDDY